MEVVVVVVVVVEVAVAVAAHHLQADEREAARPRDEQREHAQLLREHHGVSDDAEVSSAQNCAASELRTKRAA